MRNYWYCFPTSHFSEAHNNVRALQSSKMIRSSGFLSLIDVFWSFLALAFLAAFCAHKISPRLPKGLETFRVYVLFQDLIRFGKTKHPKRDDWLRLFDVPKRWFWHFYAVSACWNGFLLVLYLNFTSQKTYPPWLSGLLDILTGAPSPDTQVPQLVTVLVQLLLFSHSLRRLQECLFVSVFSDGAIHLVQYVFGLVYYIMIGLTVLASDRLEKGTRPLLSQLDWFHVAGSALFIMASFMQHQCMVQLAGLRTGKSGSVETLAHRLPEGGWFNLVSCPHYFSELLLYISLSLTYGGVSLTWWLVFLYVLFSHALSAQLCQEFYISKYESYPRNRKALIPFVL
ncbi:polyprenol reductase [Cheilinus undulatus]|uniref:polyprenol reductase n=1 Tax=Cheilinus undulatus TaxID=241271 RepID=UPI001BD466B8|nr:polyprenol reductase [Cheilinus undulatus]